MFAGLTAAGCDKLQESKPLPDAAAGTLNCLQIRNCVRTNCGGTMADQSCVQHCIEMGNIVAQSQYRNLNTCLVNICCNDTAGCGGGSPRCSAAGTPACETCTCTAQCSTTSAPCRQTATLCYGIEPDCATCM